MTRIDGAANYAALRSASRSSPANIRMARLNVLCDQRAPQPTRDILNRAPRLPEQRPLTLAALELSNDLIGL
jgi:hypothetical protein